MTVIDGAQLYALIHTMLHPTERDKVWDIHPFTTMCKYLQGAGITLMSEDNRLYMQRGGNRITPAYLQGLIDICRDQIAAKAKTQKANSFEANCLEDDAADIELLAEKYLPLENEARDRLKLKQAKEETTADAMGEYFTEPDLPAWMLF